MRGCLTVLVLGVAFLAAAAWFGGPPVAATLVEATLTSSGLEADDLDVEVAADPPLRIALGRADRVSIDASRLSWHGLRAGSASLQLTDVDLTARTAAAAEGRFEDVELSGPQGEQVLAQVDLDGPADEATTTVRIDAATVTALGIAGFERETGVHPDSAVLVAPSGLDVQAAGQMVNGTIEVDSSGALVVTSPVGTVRLIEPDISLPLRLSELSVDATGLELRRTIDVEALLR